VYGEATPPRPSGIAVVALAIAIVGCGFPFPTPFETDRAVSAEFLRYDEVEVELDALDNASTELVLAIQPHDIGTGSLESVLLAARRHGVPVRARLLLDDSDGYWPNQTNLREFRDHVDEFWRWNERGELGVKRIVVDMEPPLDDSTQLVQAIESGGIADALPVLVENRDAEAFADAQAAWAAAVDDWHDDGMLVDVVALPHLLDDFGDDDLDLQDMFESPIDGIDWDEVGFMVYQNLYGTPDARLGPDLVRSYSVTAIERYGDRAAVTLGTIGDVGKITTAIGYSDPEPLRIDVSAAATAGIANVRVFSLDGAVDHGGSAMWLDDLELVPGEVVPNPAVQQARDTIAAFDAM
jgi:hypothetical protein